MNSILTSSRGTASYCHDVSEILDPTFTPGPSQEEKELFEAKQTFMYKIFKETLLTNMGGYKVRMYLRTTAAQPLWKEYSEYMTKTSKGASEKRKLTQYVTNAVLPHAIRPRTLKNPNQRLVGAGGEDQPHSKTLKLDDGKLTIPDQRLVGGRKIISPNPKPWNIQLLLQMMAHQPCQIQGFFQLEGRKIISLIPKPWNIQLPLWVMTNEPSEISQLSS